MNQNTALYHGSILGGLDTILANAKSHTNGGRTAYALVCCRSREENFVTMGPKNGVQHYFERFPNQLKTLYDKKAGSAYFSFLFRLSTRRSSPLLAAGAPEKKAAIYSATRRGGS